MKQVKGNGFPAFILIGPDSMQVFFLCIYFNLGKQAALYYKTDLILL